MQRDDIIKIIDMGKRLEEEYGDRCLRCDHFRISNKKCRHWGQEVPEDIRMLGCEEWIDHIPF